MADLICSMICKHRSKRPLRKWRNKDGSPCFGCSLKYVKISRVFDIEECAQAFQLLNSRDKSVAKVLFKLS